jgi:hypothetical protein
MCGSMCTACESLVDIGVFSKNREAKDCFPSAPTESCDTNQFRVVEDQLCKVFGMRLDMVSNFDYMLAELFICLCGTARSSWKVPKLRFQCDQAGHHGDSQICPSHCLRGRLSYSQRDVHRLLASHRYRCRNKRFLGRSPLHGLMPCGDQGVHLLVWATWRENVLN